MRILVRPASELALWDTAIESERRRLDAIDPDSWMLDQWEEGDCIVIVAKHNAEFCALLREAIREPEGMEEEKS